MHRTADDAMMPMIRMMCARAVKTKMAKVTISWIPTERLLVRARCPLPLTADLSLRPQHHHAWCCANCSKGRKLGTLLLLCAAVPLNGLQNYIVEIPEVILPSDFIH